MYSVCVDVGFVCLLLLAFTNPLAGETKTCSYAKQRGFFAADCSSLRAFEIPSLQSDIEALDLSDNRIMLLKNDSFKCCTSIKFLYLQENSILNIEENAFQPLSDLNVLDLSYNAIDAFPLNVSPSLRRLYLNTCPNLFRFHPNELKIAHLKNLEFLSIASNQLTKFPTFGGSIPNLIELNISNNAIDRITPEDLAPLCQLKYLHVKPDSLFQSKDKLCECMKLENWTTTYDIKVDSFKCKHDGSIRLDKCDLRPSNATLEKREACLIELKNRQIPYWLMVGGGILAALICISILLYVRYRRRQRASSGKSGDDRNSAVKYDNKGDENGVNPAFNGYGGGRGVETTV